MKKLSKNSSFYFPLTEGTTKQLFQKLFIPAMKGGFSTFYVGKDFGGGRAMSMFIIENIEYLVNRWNIDINADDYQFVFINPDDLSGGSKEDYLKLIGDRLGLRIKGREYSEMLGIIRKRLKEISEKKNIVVILRGFNYLDFGDIWFWANFSSMVSGVSNLGIVFIAYSDGFKLTDNRYNRIMDLITQNVVRFDKLSKKDVDYSIRRWGYAFEKDFSSNEIAAIRKISGGRPILLKSCSNVLASGYSGDPEQVLLENKNVTKFLKGDKLQFKSGGVFFRGRSMIPMFSPQEYNVLRLSADNSGEIINKDQIADVMWGRRAVQKYSDAAISQLIKRLRNKFEILGLSRNLIKTVPTKGYIYMG